MADNSEFQTFDVWLSMVKRIPQSIDIMAQFAMPFHESMWQVATFFAAGLGFLAMMAMGVKALADPRTSVFSWFWQVAIVSVCLLPVRTGTMFSTSVNGAPEQHRVAFVVRATHQLTSIAARMIFSAIDGAAASMAGSDGAPVSTSALSVFNTAINSATGEPEFIGLLNAYENYCGAATTMKPLDGSAPIPPLTWKMMGLNGGQGLGVGCDDNGQHCDPNVIMESSLHEGWSLASLFMDTGDSTTGAVNASEATGRISDAEEILRSIPLGGGRAAPRFRVLTKEHWLQNFKQGSPGASPATTDYIQNNARGNAKWADPWVASTPSAQDIAPEYVANSSVEFFPKNCAELRDLGQLAKAQYLNALKEVHRTSLTGAGSSGYFAGNGSGQNEIVTKNAVLAAMSAIESANYAITNGDAFGEGIPQRGFSIGEPDTWSFGNAKYTAMGHNIKAHSMSGLIELGNWVQKWVVEFGLYGFVGLIAFTYAFAFAMAPIAVVSGLLPGRGKAILLVVESMVFLQACMVITYLVIKMGALAMYGLYQATADANVYNMTITPIAYLVITIKLMTLAAAVGLPVPVGMMLVFAESKALAHLKSNQMTRTMETGAATAAAIGGMAVSGVKGVAGVAKAAESAREKVQRANDRQERRDQQAADAPMKAAQASGYMLAEAAKVAKTATAASSAGTQAIAGQVGRLSQEHQQNVERMLGASSGGRGGGGSGAGGGGGVPQRAVGDRDPPPPPPSDSEPPAGTR